MPSHVTHLLFAEDSCTGTLQDLAEPPQLAYLALGAQGPDMFYHNQRRKPSGLTYGSLMHRHGYGTVVSHMASWAWSRDLALQSWAGAWVVGFATHAILDRYTHPYINYFSGWVQPGDPHTEQFRSMHPFMERLIDVAMLQSARNMHPPADWVDMMASSLAASYQVAAGDDDIRDRLNSAYLDARGYYGFTNVVDERYLEEGLWREQRGEIGARWLSIVHPLAVPDSVDVMNESHLRWTHPCDDKETFTDSFRDRYNLGVERSTAVVTSIADAWNDASQPVDRRRARIEAAVGNWNLSDGRDTERPCKKHHAGPLPLRELQASIRESVRAGRGGQL